MLTENQLQQLFSFCEKKGVRYYDLQVEMIDHLAEAIEQKMEENSTFSFDEALKEVYKGFGLFGFSHIIGEREAAIQTQYKKEFWQVFKSYFKPPVVFLSLLVMVLITTPIFWMDIKQLENFNIILWVCTIVGVLGIPIVGYVKRKKTSKKLLMLQGHYAFSLFWVVYLNYWIQRWINEFHIFTVWWFLFFNVFFVCTFVAALAKHYTTKKIYQRAEEYFPEAFVKAA